MIVKIDDGSKEYSYYMDNNLYANLMKLVDSLSRKDEDRVFIVDGREGSGKSVFCMQIGKAIDNQMQIVDVCFSPEEFEIAIKSAKQRQVIIFDEAFRGYSSRSVLSKMNKILFGMIQEIRQLNLCIILVVPSFFSLDREIALRRSWGLFHVYKHPKYPSFRMWSYYDYKKKQILYDRGRKFFNYKVIKSKSWGKFFDYYTVDEQEYRRKKKVSLLQSFNVTQDLSKAEVKWKNQRDALLCIMKEYKIHDTDISRKLEELGVKLADNSIAEARNSFTDKQKQEE